MEVPRAQRQLVHRIRHSLSAKLALAITAAALVILLVFGVIVASQLRTSMFETRRDAILADASLRFSSAQSVFSSSTATSPDQVQESARGALASLKASAAGAGATNVALLRAEGSTASLRINQVEDEQMRGLITPQMREAVAGGGAQWQSVAIRASTTDKVSPGILVGTQVQLPRAGAHELYILYSLEADQSQVDVVLRVLALTSLPIILALPIGVFALLHRLLLPVRLTVHAATKAAEGDLDVRVEVHGADEMAALGRAFNAMTSSLQDTITRYDELAKLQQRFVSDVSHELRTPLTTIRMAEEIVWDNRDDLPAHARRSAELLHDQTERMERDARRPPRNFTLRCGECPARCRRTRLAPHRHPRRGRLRGTGAAAGRRGDNRCPQPRRRRDRRAPHRTRHPQPGCQRDRTRRWDRSDDHRGYE